MRTCKFVKDSVDYSEEMVRDRIVCGIKDASLRQMLLMKDSLNLATCMKECRASEASQRQASDMASTSAGMAGETGALNVLHVPNVPSTSSSGERERTFTG